MFTYAEATSDQTKSQRTAKNKLHLACVCQSEKTWLKGMTSQRDRRVHTHPVC